MANPPMEPWQISTPDAPARGRPDASAGAAGAAAETDSFNSATGGGQISPEAYAGSMQQILRENIGLYVACEFLVGTQNIEVKEGILYDVGVSFLVLYEVEEERYVVCDFFSLRFVTFYPPVGTPKPVLSAQDQQYLQSIQSRGL